MVVRALLFAVLGLAITSGVALAHGDFAHVQIASERHSFDVKPANSHSATSPAASLHAPEPLAHSGAPCPSEEQSGDHMAGGCCNVVCHAALATFAPGPVAAIDLPATRIVGLTDMLEGRSIDRTERPPRRN